MASRLFNVRLDEKRRRIDYSWLEGPLPFVDESIDVESLPDGSTELHYRGRYATRRGPIQCLIGMLFVRRVFQRAVRERQLSMGHARALLGTPDRAFQEALARRAIGVRGARRHDLGDLDLQVPAFGLLLRKRGGETSIASIRSTVGPAAVSPQPMASAPANAVTNVDLRLMLVILRRALL